MADDLQFETLDLFPTYAEEPKEIRYSVSLIKDYQDCKAKAFARITKQPQTKSYALALGIAVHFGLEMFVKNERDPAEVFKETFRSEARKAGLPITGTAYAKSYEVGLECAKNGLEILSAKTLRGRLDPRYAEAFFQFRRNGRLYVGKIDQLVKADDGTGRLGSIIDFKTGKNSPDPFGLKNDLQFSMYFKGVEQDNSLPVGGQWADQAVYLHLRGKTVSQAKNAKKQFAFVTTRTQEQVEDEFINIIEPNVKLMEQGVFFRKKGSHCTWCQYFNQAKQDCGVEGLPAQPTPCEETGDAAAA